MACLLRSGFSLFFLQALEHASITRLLMGALKHMQAHVSIIDMIEVDDVHEERPLLSSPEHWLPTGFNRGVRVGMPVLPASAPDLHPQVSP